MHAHFHSADECFVRFIIFTKIIVTLHYNKNFICLHRFIFKLMRRSYAEQYIHEHTHRNERYLKLEIVYFERSLIEADNQIKFFLCHSNYSLHTEATEIFFKEKLCKI